jgi:hypothetical protein
VQAETEQCGQKRVLFFLYWASLIIRNISVEFSKRYWIALTNRIFTLFSNKTTLVASEIIETNLITLLLYCSSLFNKVIRLVF